MDDLRDLFVQLFKSCIDEKTKKETLPACKNYMKGPYGRQLFIEEYSIGIKLNT